MRRTAALVLTTMVLVLWGGERPNACTCMGPTSACSSVWDYSDVFVATVTAFGPFERRAGDFGGSLKATMRITEAFKGKASGDVTVLTASNSAACGYAFETGRTYLIYAYRLKDTGELGTGICSRTAPIEKAAEDLAYFRGAFRTPAALGRIEGQVTRDDPQPSGQYSGRSPMQGLSILLEWAGGSRKTITGPAGTFEFRVPAGRYALSASVPDGWYSSPNQVELKDPRGCALSNFYVQPDGRIAGRLLDADGQPAAFVPIHATDATYARSATPSRIARSLTGADGTFELHTLREGAYVLGLELAHGTGEKAWLGRETDAEVQVIRVERGARVAIGDLVLPATTRLTTVSGEIVDAAGKALTNTFVDVRPGTSDYRGPYAGSFPTDAKGQFKIALFEGHKYRLFAEQRIVTDDPSTVRAGETNAFTAAPDLPPFRIIVQKQ